MSERRTLTVNVRVAVNIQPRGPPCPSALRVLNGARIRWHSATMVKAETKPGIPAILRDGQSNGRPMPTCNGGH